MWFTTLEKMPNVSDYQQHQILWGFFPKQQQDAEQRPFCFRDTGDQLLVLSNVKPNTESKEIKFQNGQTLMFEVRMSLGDKTSGNVVTKPKDLTADQLKNRFINTFIDIADIGHVSFKNYPPHIVRKNDGHKIPYHQIMYFGVLTVLDAEKFDARISRGIGRGCAFGFGAMILPQVMK